MCCYENILNIKSSPENSCSKRGTEISEGLNQTREVLWPWQDLHYVVNLDACFLSETEKCWAQQPAFLIKGWKDPNKLSEESHSPSKCEPWTRYWCFNQQQLLQGNRQVISWGYRRKKAPQGHFRWTQQTLGNALALSRIPYRWYQSHQPISQGQRSRFQEPGAAAGPLSEQEQYPELTTPISGLSAGNSRQFPYCHCPGNPGKLLGTAEQWTGSDSPGTRRCHIAPDLSSSSSEL